jgi:oligopeptide/dipeptide ABC transporter ATP-binding protein
MSGVAAEELSPRPERGGGEPLVEVEHLTKRFPITKGLLQRTVAHVHAVEDVSFTIRRGETLGLVGESGCGKSTTARLVLKLLEATDGTVRFEGRDITRLSRREMRPLRREMQMVFQDPYSSLNPRQTVSQIIGAPFAIHKTPGSTKTKVQDLMNRVGLNPEHYNRYPHEFSGGQRQRIGVARALALSPKLIVCDEPVSALDVSIQAQILNLLLSLQQDFDLTYLFISHDLGVVRHVSDRIAVMYLGHIVEVGDAEAVHAEPKHPYTAALLSAVPKGDSTNGTGRRERIVLTGDVPSPVDPPAGCPFHPRCPKARLVSGSADVVPENCANVYPELRRVGAQDAACWYPLESADELRRVAQADVTEQPDVSTDS